jgi:desulfoferrodoxin-like iron-binding protein
MNVTDEGQKFRCEICGNEVVVTSVGGGELVCCNEPMGLME